MHLVGVRDHRQHEVLHAHDGPCALEEQVGQFAFDQLPATVHMLQGMLHLIGVDEGIGVGDWIIGQAVQAG